MADDRDERKLKTKGEYLTLGAGMGVALGAGLGAAIDNIAKTVVPTKGAVVRVKYNTWIGQKAMMTLTYNGKPVPFGAMASVEGTDHNSFIVGDSGQVYLTGLDPEVNLTVKWGNQSANTCRVHYSINMTKLNNDVIIDNAVCR